MDKIKVQYEKRNRLYNKLLGRQKKAFELISNLRLAVFIFGAAAAVFLYITRNYYLLIADIIAFLVGFIYLVIRHNKLLDNKTRAALLRDINDDSIKRLEGDWIHFTDEGKDFRDENHSFSYDLDIFGSSSLFQWISAASTYIGRQMLRDLLTLFPSGATEIYAKQKAIEELAKNLRWRQRFLAEGMINSNKLQSPDKLQSPEKLISWAEERNEFFGKPWVIYTFRTLPIITVILMLLTLTTALVPYYIPALALAIHFILLAVKAWERQKIFGIATKYKDDLKVYYNMIKLFEKQKFDSTHLNDIKKTMYNNEEVHAWKQIDKLSKIIESISNRQNMLFFVINLITLWDYHNIIALEKWKEKSGYLLKSWLYAIGRVEALASLAIIKHDNQDWVMPKISEGINNMLEAKGMGHPLITGSRISNDLSVGKTRKILLITGSNMSGKSTLLRTAGINLVLAYAGAPVCASYFNASLMQIHSCMRVSDNLMKSTSSFYAELLRIKEILKEAVAGTKVFFLLDEIFKGTNSIDRHTGARVLIDKLSRTNSIGLVSTHDLELCDLEKSNSLVGNYHFIEYYKNGNIHFDYKLRPGASTTRNAIYLMKMIGIDIVENSIDKL